MFTIASTTDLLLRRMVGYISIYLSFDYISYVLISEKRIKGKVVAPVVIV